jgi:hypothetical protein
LLAAAERQRIDEIDHCKISHVERGETFVRGQIQRIRRQAGSVASGRLIQEIAIVQRFRKGVDATQRESMPEAAPPVHLPRMVRAATPMRGCGSAFALFWLNSELPIIGAEEITPSLKK